MSVLAALGLTTKQALAVVRNPDLRKRWQLVAPAFTVVGVGDSGAQRILDPGVLASYLGDPSSPPVFHSGDTATDYAYNLARQVLSADQLSEGRSGLLLTSTSNDTPANDSKDYATALTRLWESWPLNSVIADRDRGILVESDQIRSVNIAGVAGPLSVPSSRQGRPVLLWRAGDAAEVAIAPPDTDLLIVDAPVFAEATISGTDLTWLLALEVQGRPDEVQVSVTDAINAGAVGALFHSPGTNTNDANDDNDAEAVHALLDSIRSLKSADLPNAAPRNPVGGAVLTARELLGLPVPRESPSFGDQVFSPPTVQQFQSN